MDRKAMNRPEIVIAKYKAERTLYLVNKIRILVIKKMIVALLAVALYAFLAWLSSTYGVLTLIEAILFGGLGLYFLKKAYNSFEEYKLCVHGKVILEKIISEQLYKREDINVLLNQIDLGRINIPKI